MSARAPALLLTGDPRHGVALYARQLAGAVAARCPAARIVTEASGAEPLHVHFTDRLWAQTPERAAERLEAIARDRRVTVTLHDVPQPSDGTGLSRRRDAYRRVAAAAAGIVVSSAHEHDLLRTLDTVPPACAVEVVPLPIMPVPDASAPGGVACRDEVALLGYVYPGKGHAAAIDAVAALPPPRPAVRALGAASPGHDDEVAALRERARRRAVDFAVTGWLDEAALLDRVRQARVPLAAHDHVSASGSINLWIAAGRIPLVADSPYARELARLRPGTIRRYEPARLSEAIAELRCDPAAGVRAPGVSTRPHLADAAARYLEWWGCG